MSENETAASVDRVLAKIGADFLVEDHHVFLVHQPELCLPLTLEALQAARSEIVIEFYWLASDNIGQRFAAVLAERAQAGVAVYIIYDAVGSWQTEPALFDSLRAAGCHVASYHPFYYWLTRLELDILNQRNHRKMLVIDGHYAMTGSVNIGDEWMPISQGGSGWRDDAIWVVGAIAGDMRKLFFRSWQRLRPGFRLASLKQFPKRLRRPQAFRRDSLPPPSTQRSIQVLYNSRTNRRTIRRFYLDIISRSTKTICISNSYFIPDWRVRLALCRAARRGVDVRVLLPEKSDVPAAQYASQLLYGNLLRNGVKIFEYQGAVLHAKSATVDDQWCTVGSYNLDYRSWMLNLEMNIAVANAPVARALRQQFDEDLKQARQIDLQNWSARPIKQRLLETFFFTFRRLL